MTELNKDSFFFMTNKPTTAQELEELLGKVDWEKVFKDELTAEVKRQLDYNMSIILYGTPGEVMKINRPMNFLEKLDAGWYWFRECFEEWYCNWSFRCYCYRQSFSRLLSK